MIPKPLQVLCAYRRKRRKKKGGKKKEEEEEEEEEYYETNHRRRIHADEIKKRAAFSVVSLSQPQERIIRKQTNKKKRLMRFERTHTHTHTHTHTQSVLHKSVYFTVRSS